MITGCETWNRGKAEKRSGRRSFAQKQESWSPDCMILVSHTSDARLCEKVDWARVLCKRPLRSSAGIACSLRPASPFRCDSRLGATAGGEEAAADMSAGPAANSLVPRIIILPLIVHN